MLERPGAAAPEEKANWATKSDDFVKAMHGRAAEVRDAGADGTKKKDMLRLASYDHCVDMHSAQKAILGGGLEIFAEKPEDPQCNRGV